jgi:Ribbon-helix-helix protein, copG family
MPYADHPHKIGPPYRGTGPTTTLSLRLTHEEQDALDRIARKRKTPRAVLIRAALDAAGLFG